MKYQIISQNKRTTSTGKNLIEATVTDETGKEIEKVTFWESNWPNLATLAVSGVVEGDLVEKQNGQYTNRTIYPPKDVVPGRTGGRGGMAGMKAAQERKAEMIEKAQERKNDAIAWFNSLNNAIEFCKANALDGPFTVEQVLRTQEQFLAAWRTYDAGDVTDKRIPF